MIKTTLPASKTGALSIEKEYVIVLITTPSQEVSEMIANTLFEKKLASCANMMGAANYLAWIDDVTRQD